MMSSSTPAISTKDRFRPRPLDPNKRMPIRIRKKCRNLSPKVKRALVAPPSGMEKEEEMEVHLQQALEKKSTVQNRSSDDAVIPIPKVFQIQGSDYDRLYQKHNSFDEKPITFQGAVQFFINQSVYNADSEDEAWFASQSKITIDEFEHIIEKLELASQNGTLIQPKNAKVLLQRFDPGIVDDVYDYWLIKRKKAASRNAKCPVLMPKCATEARRDEKVLLNPYIAFRRRTDKVQTRKKQKAELMTYEKMLRLNYMLKTSIVISEMLMQKEKLKMALLDCDQSIFNQMFTLYEKGEDTSILEATLKTMKQIPQNNLKENSNYGKLNGFSLDSQLSKPRFPNKIGLCRIDFNSRLDEHIQKNQEAWDNVLPLCSNISQDISSSTEMEKVAIYNVNSSVDGRYEFKRKIGCNYMAPLSLALDTRKSSSSKFCAKNFLAMESNIPTYRYYYRRKGRGGRVMIDLM